MPEKINPPQIKNLKGAKPTKEQKEKKRLGLKLQEGQGVDQKKQKNPLFADLYFSKEKDFFIENLSILTSSGMSVPQAMNSLKEQIRSPKMTKVIENAEQKIRFGSPVWQALKEQNIFSPHIISLIRIGELSGSLVENLKIISIQEKKSQAFKAKIRSALFYPLFVLFLAFIIGLGIAWFILPQLAGVFTQIKVELPFLTRLLIGAGGFLRQHGFIFVPAAIVLVSTIIYVVFLAPKTRWIGQKILFRLPVINELIQQVELTHFSYFLGILLKAGLSIVDALQALDQATNFPEYKKFYRYLTEEVANGRSLKQSFKDYKDSDQLIPTMIQQLVISGEESGSLAPTLLEISNIYEEKIDITAKNLGTLLEPLFLIAVWIIVMFIALAVIIPIYGLIGELR